MSQHSTFSEKRQFGRRPTFQHGWVKIPGRPPLACVLRNMSDGGALLIFDTPQCLPFGFLLDIEGKQQTYGCEVRHHYGVKVGVEFVDVATIQQSRNGSYDGTVGSWIETSTMMQPPNWPQV